MNKNNRLSLIIELAHYYQFYKKVKKTAKHFSDNLHNSIILAKSKKSIGSVSWIIEYRNEGSLLLDIDNINAIKKLNLVSFSPTQKVNDVALGLL